MLKLCFEYVHRVCASRTCIEYDRLDLTNRRRHLNIEHGGPMFEDRQMCTVICWHAEDIVLKVVRVHVWVHFGVHFGIDFEAFVQR